MLPVLFAIAALAQNPPAPLCPPKSRFGNCGQTKIS
jgi:hypothetical protein